MVSTGRILLLVLLLLPGGWLSARGQPVCALDSEGQRLCLPQPAQRIVALSPGHTELLYAAGAGERLVGVVSWSDFPEAANQLPRVGNHARLDLETILSLEPDLILAWPDGNAPEQLQQLQGFGLPVFRSRPMALADVPVALQAFGELAGSDPIAQAAAAGFVAGLDALKTAYRDTEPVRVFYQVWEQPLMTVNGQHWISEVLQLCGGVNVFADLPRLVPRLDIEAVLAARPDLVLTGASGQTPGGELALWRPFTDLPAVRNGHLVTVDASLLARPTPRLLAGARAVCEALDAVRSRG